MKKATAKKKVATKKKAAPAKKASPAKKTAAATATKAAPLETQPQSKQKAAVQAGVFLHIDDHWSRAYFDPADLHSEERELFG